MEIINVELLNQQLDEAIKKYDETVKQVRVLLFENKELKEELDQANAEVKYWYIKAAERQDIHPVVINVANPPKKEPLS